MILCLDISTSVVGVTLADNDGNLIELTHIEFKDTKNHKLTLFEKLKQFMILIDSLVEKTPNGTIKTIVVEEPLKRFKGKFSNADTLSKLNNFNGMICGSLYLKYYTEPIFINVNSARKLAFPNLKLSHDGGNSSKHEIWSQVMQLLPQINWEYSSRTAKLKDSMYDRSDSYVQLLAFLVMKDKQINIQSLQEN